MKSNTDEENDNPEAMDDSYSDEEKGATFDPSPIYKEILEHMNPGETVTKALCRLGKRYVEFTFIIKVKNFYIFYVRKM